MNLIGLYFFFAFWHWDWCWFYVQEYRIDFLQGVLVLIAYQIIVELINNRNKSLKEFNNNKDNK